MTEQSAYDGDNIPALTRVRALLNKAERTDNDAERDIYNAKASELIAKYGIDRARLAAADPHSDTPTTREVIVPGPYAAQKAVLLLGIASAMRGNGVYFATTTTAKRVVLYGFSSDLERAEMLFTSLLVQMSHSLAKVETPPYENPRAFRTAWVFGFRRTAVARIRAHEERAATEAVADNGGTGMELVLASRREVAKNMKEQANPQVRHFKQTATSRTGYREGVAAGELADIGVTKVGGRAARRLPAAN